MSNCKEELFILFNHGNYTDITGIFTKAKSRTPTFAFPNAFKTQAIFSFTLIANTSYFVTSLNPINPLTQFLLGVGEVLGSNYLYFPKLLL